MKTGIFRWNQVKFTNRDFRVLHCPGHPKWHLYHSHFCVVQPLTARMPSLHFDLFYVVGTRFCVSEIYVQKFLGRVLKHKRPVLRWSFVDLGLILLSIGFEPISKV